MKRLIKKSSDDDMSLNEIVDEVKVCLKNMANNTNEWAVRDSLCNITAMNWYQGDEMVSFDVDSAKEFAENLLTVVDLLEEDDLIEVYECVSHYYNY